MNTASYNQTAADALNSISAVLTTDDLVALNNLVDIQRKQPDQVAKDWLTQQGLLTS